MSDKTQPRRAQVSRRKFLAMAGLGTGLGLAACVQSPSVVPLAVPTQMPGMGAGSPTPTGNSADDMDAMHKKGIDTFVANAGKDKTFWHQPMAFTTDGEVKVFDLTCSEGKWEIEPGNAVDAMLYNGMVPGPEIRVTEGDKVRVVCHNQMTQSTAIHFHGLILPNNMDGVPFITQDPIKPGGTFKYEFTVRNPGSHMYHSHHNAAEQVTKGLMGAFIIEPKDKSSEPKVDADYTLVLNDAGIGLTLNGKSFPATQPIIAKLGQTIRIRYMNEGLQIHPMHLHGLPQTVFAKDGWPLPMPYKLDTLTVAPGERWDVTVVCDQPGVWAFHCHILIHAESAQGMFGMVTAVIVQA
jgi:FtsP/CotA-like multicopper oxidase with cupredoxin domain